MDALANRYRIDYRAEGASPRGAAALCWST